MLLEKTKLFTKEYKETISEALNVLGKKNLALILQGVSFPSRANENTGFGTYNSDSSPKNQPEAQPNARQWCKHAAHSKPYWPLRQRPHGQWFRKFAAAFPSRIERP